MNSAESRYWGEPDFPQERVIGKSCFVCWPLTKRFGWGQKWRFPDSAGHSPGR